MRKSVTMPAALPAKARIASQPASMVRSDCPQCSAPLVVQLIIPGKSGMEYWTLRCTKCGHLHLDAIDASLPVSTQIA